MFWNCQGIRPKRKELQLYLTENSIDIIALNETFLNKKYTFKVPGYDTIRKDRSTGVKGGVAFLVKHGLVVNKEYRNEDFNIITDNEALAINLELSNNQNLTLATIYCPNGNPSSSLFHTISNLSDNVMFIGDFNSKLESFGCAKKNTSGPMLKTIQNKLNLIYLNNDEHTHMDRANGSTDILDMAFVSPNLAIHDIQFQIGDDLGSDHLPIEISIDTTPHRNTYTNHTKYKFDQTDREVFESTLEEALGSADFSGPMSTSDLDKYADFIIAAISTAVDKAIPISKSVRPESTPISDETRALIKEKRKLRRLYSQKKDPAVKTRINQLQKQVKEDLKLESLVSWENFCNSISLESDPSKSWRKIKNFLKPKGQRDYPTLHHANKVAKTNADKAQLFAESVERHFGIESDHFDSNHFHDVNKFAEDNHRHFYPPEDPDDYRFDVGNEHELVADVDATTLIKLVKFLKRGKAPGPDTIPNEVLRLGTTTSLFHHLAKLFTSSIQLGYIPTAWKIATLRMLLKPDKLPSLTTSYRPISLISSIMKLFERVIEQRLRSHLEHIGFINKHQSGFRRAKSTDDHLFRLSQSIMESFNKGEHVVAAFLDVEKAFDNVWHNGLRYKIFQLDLPTKMTRWLSDFLVGRLIQVNVNNFFSNQINPKAGVPQGSVLSPLLFLIYVNDLPAPHHNQNSLSQFADDTAQWAFSLSVRIAAKLLQQDLLNLAMWCAKWRIKLNPEKTKVIIFSRSILARKTELNLKLYGETLKIYPQVKFLGITFDSQLNFKKHFEDILDRCNTRYYRLRLLANKKWGPSPSTLIQIYKQCVRPIFEYGALSTISTSDNIISKIQRLQNKFIRLALRLPKYICSKLLHDSTGLPYVKDRLLSCATMSLDRIAQNPLVEESISRNRLNPAWDRFPTPLSVVRPGQPSA